MKRILLAAFAICCAVAVYPVLSAPTYYTDRAAFDAATGGGLNFESFENDFSSAPTVAFPGFSVSETGGTNGVGQLRDFPGFVDGAITDGTGAVWYFDNGLSIGTFFSFTTPITAIGMDIASSPGSTVTIGGSVNDSIVLVDNTASFWGVIDPNGITSVTFDTSGTGISVGFDAVSYGVAGALPTTYTVGGTVSGLTGTGLALQNNGGDTLAVAADGPFTFVTALADLAAYAVTVSAQPIGQTCSVTNGSGNIAAANVTNVDVDCVGDVVPPPPAGPVEPIPTMSVWGLGILIALMGLIGFNRRRKM